ncbi:MAG TPA: hypothetical protein VH643_22115 [Gemmataceae bacterium]|jgi:hypothetical protein
MRSHLLPVFLALLVALVLLTQTSAQDKDKGKPKKAPPPPAVGEGDDYRQYFKKPTNTAEFWKALQFEIDVGKYELAANHLRGLINFKPSDEDLVKLADEVGVAAFLRLRNVPKWSDNAKVNKEAVDNVEALIKRVTDAVNKVRRDPVRIQGYLKNLHATPEESAYALKQLAKSGAIVVPYIIDSLKSADADERVRLLDALRRLGPDTIAPMAAALDSNIPTLQVDLLKIFRQRYSRQVVEQVVPYLWFLSASPSQPEEVRREATATLAYFLETKAGKLPPAKVELTRLAERYYLHRVKFPNAAAVTVWRWDGDRVVEGWPGAPTITADKAEEYYGIRYASQALLLDRGYTPAQVVLLSLILDKTQSKAGLDKTLERAAPEVHGLLGTVQPDLVNAVLERALEEHRVAVILGAVRDLGEREEVRAARPMGRRQPPLVRALYYPDRRVEMAAAEALLRIPNSAASLATTRVVEVLRRAVAAEPVARQPAKVVVGYFNEDVRNGVAAAVAAAGYDPVKVATGRELMQRLGQASDIALLIFGEDLPMPELPYLLGQIRADTFASRLPILLTTAPPNPDLFRLREDDPRRALLLADAARREEALRRKTATIPTVTVIPGPLAIDAKALQPLIASRLDDPASPALTAAELKAYSERSIKNLARLARGEVAGYDVVPAGPTVLAALRAPSKLTPEGQIAAIEVVSRLRSEDAQTVLADTIADAKRPAAVRIAAVNGLVRSIQEFSPLLTRAQVAVLAGLYAQPKLEAPLRNSLAPLLGSLQPSARLSGQRLLEYQPPVPGAPPPKKEK